jgi:hypothetical protein
MVDHLLSEHGELIAAAPADAAWPELIQAVVKMKREQLEVR